MMATNSPASMRSETPCSTSTASVPRLKVLRMSFSSMAAGPRGAFIAAVPEARSYPRAPRAALRAARLRRLVLDGDPLTFLEPGAHLGRDPVAHAERHLAHFDRAVGPHHLDVRCSRSEEHTSELQSLMRTS